MRILICGHRAYAARGLAEKLKAAGHEVTCFSRGEQKREGNVVTGKVNEIDRNPYLKVSFDAVVNFILLKDGTFEDNIAYISALCRFCKEQKVGKLIHLSSISSYPNDTALITEETETDHNAELKGGYGAKKVVVDEYLYEQRDNEGLPVVFVRPGFITADDHPNPIGGIVMVLPGGFGVLMGDKKSSLSLVSREDVHYAIEKVATDENPLPVYLLVRKGDFTKAMYAKGICPQLKLIGLPKGLLIGLAKVLKAIHVFDERKVQMVAGQFKVQTFDAEKTYKKIGKVL